MTLEECTESGRRSGACRLATRRAILSVPAVAAAAAVVVLASSSAFGQPTPRGSEFEFNSYTTGGQSRPAIDANANGQFVAVWRSDYSLGDDTSSGSVQGRRFDSAGNPIGSDFQVNSYITGNQDNADVAMNDDGSFVVVWTSPEISAQRFDSTGSPAGSQFQVNGVEAGNGPTEPAVASAGNGDFVVVFQSSYGSLDPLYDGVWGQRYASNGAKLGSNFLVNTITTGDQRRADVAMAADGGFVVVWDSTPGYPQEETIQGQRFDSNGDPIDSQFLISTYTTGAQRRPAVDLDPDGHFLVVWDSYGSAGTDSSEESIHARLWYLGEGLGNEVQVNSYTTGRQFAARVSADGQGNFLVVWQSGQYYGAGPDGSGYSIQAQDLTDQLQPAGGEIQVNSYATSDQSDPVLAYRGRGEFVVAWQSRGSSGADQAYSSILGQRLWGAATIFVDGFETGNTEEWSSTVPPV